MGIYQPDLLCFVLCYDFHVVRWGRSPKLDLILSRNGLILLRNGFQVMGAQSEIGLNSKPKWLDSTPKWLSSHSLKRGSVTADNSTLRIAYRFISNL